RPSASDPPTVAVAPAGPSRCMRGCIRLHTSPLAGTPIVPVTLPALTRAVFSPSCFPSMAGTGNTVAVCSNVMPDPRRRAFYCPCRRPYCGHAGVLFYGQGGGPFAATAEVKGSGRWSSALGGIPGRAGNPASACGGSLRLRLHLRFRTLPQPPPLPPRPLSPLSGGVAPHGRA
ncbi:MAG: hypothetical protein IJM35_08020, partial [Bacteroidales bacterium]|nr:hypothetical protein [Bacteroidales bacterium]